MVVPLLSPLSLFSDLFPPHPGFRGKPWEIVPLGGGKKRHDPGITLRNRSHCFIVLFPAGAVPFQAPPAPRARAAGRDG